MSRDIYQRIAEAVEGGPARSIEEAYERVLEVLKSQLSEYESVWSVRFPAHRFAGMRAARQQLTDDVQLVQALLAAHRGMPIPTRPAIERKQGGRGYGEK